MAIIRTTNNETPGGGHPPRDGEPGQEKEKSSPTKSVVAQRRKASAAKATPRQPLPGTQTQGNTSRNFFADTMTELKRVVWPTRDEVTSGSVVTLLLLFFFGIYIGVLDFVAQGLFNMLGLYGH